MATRSSPNRRRVLTRPLDTIRKSHTLTSAALPPKDKAGPGNHPQATRSAKRCPIPRRAICRAGQHGVRRNEFSTLDLALFAGGTFAAAFVTGLAGFAKRGAGSLPAVHFGDI